MFPHFAPANCSRLNLCATKMSFAWILVFYGNKIDSNLKQERDESLNLQYLRSFFHQHIIILQGNKNNMKSHYPDTGWEYAMQEITSSNSLPKTNTSTLHAFIYFKFYSP